MQEGGGFEDGPDPALDPSLVIPTLQPEETQLEPEAAPVKPEAARPAKSRAKSAAAPAPDSPKPAARRTAPAATGQRQNKAPPPPPKRVVSIDDDVNIQTEDEKEAYLWMELRNSMRSKRILTGILGGVERSANGLCSWLSSYSASKPSFPRSLLVRRTMSDGQPEASITVGELPLLEELPEVEEPLDFKYTCSRIASPSALIAERFTRTISRYSSTFSLFTPR